MDEANGMTVELPVVLLLLLSPILLASMLPFVKLDAGITETLRVEEGYDEFVTACDDDVFETDIVLCEPRPYSRLVGAGL